jgi:hypothetical protein
LGSVGEKELLIITTPLIFDFLYFLRKLRREVGAWENRVIK